jgi:ParB family chromosome partitioning protein
MFAKLDKKIKENQAKDGVQLIELNDIEIKKQIRVLFEDDENSLLELGESLKKLQLQPIGIRANSEGSEKPYVLVWGERRYRGARLVGLERLEAKLTDLSDEEAKDAQFAENVHRKNFEQYEEAAGLQGDLDNGFTVENLIRKHAKSKSWVSKRLSLLNLGEQSKRVISQDVSADVEVIIAVKTIESINPEKAKELVDELIKNKGEKQNVRDKVNQAKAEVKPPMPKAEIVKTPDVKVPGAVVVTNEVKEQVTEIENIEESEAVKEQRLIKDTLSKIYFDIFEHGHKPQDLFNDVEKNAKSLVSDHLRICFDSGVKSKDAARDALRAFRNGGFGEDGHLAFAWVAFMHGACGQKFSVVNILGCVKP